MDLVASLPGCFRRGDVEQFLSAVGNHRRCNINYDASHFIKQGLDYVAFIDLYHERIKGFHVKDAEFRPTGKQGFFSGYQPWLKRAARDRSLGDGQVDFNQIFSKLAEYDFDGWAVYEWEDCLKHPEVAAAEGTPFIAAHIIRVTDRAFDDFAGAGGEQILSAACSNSPDEYRLRASGSAPSALGQARIGRGEHEDDRPVQHLLDRLGQIKKGQKAVQHCREFRAPTMLPE